MANIEEILTFCDRVTKERKEINEIGQKMVIDLLKERGSVEWDWEDDYAPSISSCAFSDDLADCYITKIYLDGDYVKVGLHAYYLCEDKDVSLASEPLVDWVDILECMAEKLDQ